MATVCGASLALYDAGEYIIYMYMAERCRRKEEESKLGQTNNKAKQRSTPKAVTFHIHVHVHTCFNKR